MCPVSIQDMVEAPMDLLVMANHLENMVSHFSASHENKQYVAFQRKVQYHEYLFSVFVPSKPTGMLIPSSIH